MPSEVAKKRCNGCGKLRLVKFYTKRVRPGRKDQLAARCKDCVTKGNRERWERRKRERELIKSGEILPPVARLPVGPFKAWCAQRVEKYDSIADFCQVTEMNERRVYDLMNDRQKTVTLEVVDRALTREGSTFLWELYPDLYP